MRSIRSRLAIGLALPMMALFLVQFFLINYAEEHLSEEFLQDRLRDDAESMLSALRSGERGLVLPETRLSNIYQRPFSGHYFIVATQDEQLRSRSLWDAPLSLPMVQLGEIRFVEMAGPEGQQLSMRVAGYRKYGKDIIVAVAMDITDFQQDMLQLRLTYGVVSIFALLLLLMIQLLIISTGLRPLSEARRELDAISRGEVEELDEVVPQEVRPFVREVNRLLRLLRERLQRSRNAMGNLAHALKTPLAVLTQLADEKELENLPGLKQKLRAQTEQMRALTERELKRARLAGGNDVAQFFSPQRDVSMLVEALESIYRQRDLAFDIDLPRVDSVKLDREDILELLGNLLDNACKWARQQVHLAITLNDVVDVVVEDDGPGVDQAKLRALRARGVRVDESTAGHGLGLSIVADTVGHYGGQLELGRSERLGGFCARVRLPLAGR